MTKAPQIKAQALTAGLFHAHKPPLVPAHSALPIIQAIQPSPYPGNSFLPFIRAILPCLSYRLFCYLHQRSNLILAINPCPATANRHQGRSAVSLASSILSLQFTPGRPSSTTTDTQHLPTSSAASDCAIPLSHQRIILSL